MKPRIRLYSSEIKFQYRLGGTSSHWIDGPEYLRTIHELRAYLAGKEGRYVSVYLRRIDACSQGSTTT